MIPLTILDVLRTLFAFVLYTILPGSGLVYVLYRKRSLPILEFMSLCVGWSLPVNALAAFGTHWVGGTLTDYGSFVVLLDVLSIGFILLHILRSDTPVFVVEKKTLRVVALTLLVGMLWFGVILQNGPRVDYAWDQWFHVAHIREAMESDRILPDHPFWADLALSEVYGLWHMILAAAGRTLGVDVLLLWRVGHAYLAAIGFIVMYVVGALIMADPWTSFLAAIVFLGSGVGALEITRTFIYPWGISYLCMWLSLGVFFRYWKEARPLDLLSATMIGLMPILMHPQEYILLCFATFALGSSVAFLPLVFPSVPQVRSKRIWTFFALLLILGAPLLLGQYSHRITGVLRGHSGMQGLNPALPMYQHPLSLWLAAAFPYFWKVGMLYYALVNFNIISLLTLHMLPGYLDTKSRRFLTTLTWAPIVAAVVPGFSWLTQQVLKETYAWRLLNLIPSPMIWALLIRKWLFFGGNSAKRAVDTSEKRRLIDWAYFAIALVFLGVVAVSVGRTIVRDELEFVEDPVEANLSSSLSPLQSRRVFDQLDQLMAEPGIVLSDPTTSYAVPGLTKHHVVLNEPSHGKRDDLLLRFSETRALLSSSSQSAGAALATLRKYNVDFILVHKRWVDRVFFAKMPFYSDYTLKFLNENSACFRRVYHDAYFEAFQYLQCDPSDIRHKGISSESTVSVEDMGYSTYHRFTQNLSLLGFSLSDGREVQAGENVDVEVYWQFENSIYEPYAVWLELACDYPGAHLPYGKVFRLVREKATGTVFDVETFAWMPMPPAPLGRGDMLSQSFTLQVPSNMSTGLCSLNMYVLTRRQALYDREALPFLLMEKAYTLPGQRLQMLEIQPRSASSFSKVPGMVECGGQ